RHNTQRLVIFAELRRLAIDALVQLRLARLLYAYVENRGLVQVSLLRLLNQSDYIRSAGPHNPAQSCSSRWFRSLMSRSPAFSDHQITRSSDHPIAGCYYAWRLVPPSASRSP